MKIETLMKDLPESYSPVDRQKVEKAYLFAEKAHEGQTRASGEAYITHCVAVADILAELKVPPETVIAGLLHDTVEDTSVTLEDLTSEFGEEIAKMVDGVTKLSNLPRVSRGDHSSAQDGNFQEQTEILTDPDKRNRKKDLRNESLRKTFIAMGEDVRVIIIKLADRLHNMRTLSHIKESERREKIARETQDIFAPLANRLGLWRIKWELEDLSFRYLDPPKYKEIAKNLDERRSVREKQIQDIILKLEIYLKNASIDADISGRPKHIYSIYRKMIDKGEPFEMVRDLRGVRLLVKDIPTCYAALGVIHTHWRPIPQEFDDYIAAPKDNFYQSLHTAVIYDDGKPLEVQIRTFDMHQSAEYGIAAHWRYKEKGARNDSYQQQITWLRKLMEWRQEVEDAQEFVDGMKTDVFQDRVYVFTPQGDIIDLPVGSTPIDFAYHVHTEIGNRCRGAKVNGKLVTLDYCLKTGDQVHILTSKKGGPSRDWLNKSLDLVKTQRARSKIRQWFKRQDREQNLAQGKMILDRELQRLGLENIELEKLAAFFEYSTEEDLYVGLGCGDLSMGKIINRLSDLDQEEDLIFKIKPPSTKTREDTNAVTVMGMRGMQTTISRCCDPAPGDDIIGYITRGRGVSIHRRDCPNVLRIDDKERLIWVSWGEPFQTFNVSIEVKAYDRHGLMSDISNILNNEGINVVDVSMKTSRNLVVINLSIEICDINQLSRVLTKTENLPNILEAHRLKPG